MGKEQSSEVTGHHGLGERNEQGNKWVQWCSSNRQVITNAWFEKHPRRLWTWKSPGGDTKNQIDYITINKRFRNAITDSTTCPSADCGSDHRLIVCTMRVKLKKIRKSQTHIKITVFHATERFGHAYAVAVQNRFEALEGEGTSKWDTMKEAIVTSAKEIIPKKEKSLKKSMDHR